MANRATLVDRLRGIYTIPVNDGCGLLNGKDTYTNTFTVPRINHEAAEEIERLRKGLEDIIHHHEIMGGQVSRFSTIRLIAQNALNPIDAATLSDTSKEGTE